MKIAISGNYGAGNLGDELILEGLLKMLREIEPKIDITVLSGDPGNTEKIHKVEAVPMFPSGLRSFFKPSSKTQEAVKECSYFILGGGGLFGSLKFRANIIWAIQALMALRLKKPLLCLGQSMGQVKNPILKSLIKKVFSQSKLITVRDQQSKKNLQEIGIENKIHILPDFAFNKDLYEDQIRENSIVVALRKMDNINSSFIQDVAQFLDWLSKEKNYKIQFANFQKGNNADELLHQKVQEQMTEKYTSTIGWAEIFEAFQKSKFVLGMRLHSIITAIKSKTPFIAINYAEKVHSLLSQYGLNKQIIDLDDISFEELKARFNETEKSELTKKLQQVNEQAVQKFQEAKKLLKSSLEKE